MSLDCIAPTSPPPTINYLGGSFLLQLVGSVFKMRKDQPLKKWFLILLVLSDQLQT